MDKDHDGILSLSEIASKRNGSAVHPAIKEAANSLVEKDNKTGQYIWRPGLDANKDGVVNIDKELKYIGMNGILHSVHWQSVCIVR